MDIEKDLITKFNKQKRLTNQEEILRKESRLGEIYTTNEGYKITIISYKDSKNCSVIFENGYISEKLHYRDIKKGAVKNPYHRTCKDIGFIGVGKYSCSNHKYFNSVWAGIIRRCYNEKERSKTPTYENVDMCEEWHNFQNFAQWFEENYNPETMEGWHLDKDILVKGNKIYSPDTCCFVPQEINKLFTKRNLKRGELPIGVSLGKYGKFLASFTKNNTYVYLGSFKTIEEAFQAYKQAKEDYIKKVADKWKDKIDPRVHQALINYKVEIHD